MDFLNDIGKKFSSMARSVTERSREGVESTRLLTDLRSAKNDLEELYCEYGKACYEIHMGGGDDARAEDLAARIGEMLERIRALTAQREEMRAVRRCPACGSNQSREARFCASCGARLPEEAPRTEPVADAEEEFCPGCGALREGTERFCPVCGKDFEAPEEPEAGKTPEPVRAKPAFDAEEPDQESTME